MKQLPFFAMLAVVVCSAPAYSGLNDEEYLERKGAICEPQLLERRAAEDPFKSADFLRALLANSVQLRMQRSGCSGTYITPNCVLTAAHCLASLPKNAAIDAWNGNTIAVAGKPYFDKDFRKATMIGEVSGDDLGVVVFKKPFAGFKEIAISIAPGNLSLWFYEADKPDHAYKGNLEQFDNGHWRDLGTLGLTGYSAPANNKPFGLCSDSAFAWSPCFLYRSGERTPTFETGVLCIKGEMGPGMSGGAFYTPHAILGVNVEEPSAEGIPAAIPIKDHWWHRYPNSFFSSNLNEGFANRVKILLPEDRKLIETHCPGAIFEPLPSSKGLRVRDPDLVSKKATSQFWLPGGVDVWRKLRLEDRLKRVNRPLRPGEHNEFVRRLQARLKDLGLFKGSPDGGYGETTIEAVGSFQKSLGLKSTGKADETTLKELGIWFARKN
jgi:hypothetical protein